MGFGHRRVLSGIWESHLSRKDDLWSESKPTTKKTSGICDPWPVNASSNCQIIVVNKRVPTHLQKAPRRLPAPLGANDAMWAPYLTGKKSEEGWGAYFLYIASWSTPTNFNFHWWASSAPQMRLSELIWPPVQVTQDAVLVILLLLWKKIPWPKSTWGGKGLSTYSFVSPSITQRRQGRTWRQ